MSKNQYYVRRGLKFPDELRIARYERSPELGPRVLFFSGGSALRDLSRKLIKYSHNSIHLMTPFDSGGSSAVLRKAFDMPAIGDLRARLMALADNSVRGLPDVFNLFSKRLPFDTPHPVLEQQLDQMTQGIHPLVAAIPEPMRQIICNQLSFFQQHKPDNFNLRGASIGNLILSGGYLNNTSQLEPIVFLFSKLVEVRGTVRLTVNDNYHLTAELQNGEIIIGQHKMTGKEFPPICSPIKSIFLSDSLEKVNRVESILGERHAKLIRNADMVCFPPGSFYSSILANLLPKGVGKAIAANNGPKIYIPNKGVDPEMLGMSLDDAVAKLLDIVMRDNDEPVSTKQIISHILLDESDPGVNNKLDQEYWLRQGIQVVRSDLAGEESKYYDNEKLLQILLSFC